MASAAKVTPLRPPPPVVEDDDDDNSPPCPPVGAPAWLATFADIATNLTAFFVLILGFAKFDEVSFKKMAGSMRETFGTEMVSPILENQPGAMMIEMNFKPQGMPPDSVEGEEPPTGDEGPNTKRDGPADGRAPEEPGPDAAEKAAAEAAGAALMQALASGGLEVQQGDKSVTVKIPEGPGQPSAEEVAEALSSLAKGKAEGEGGAEGETSGEGASGGATGEQTGEQSGGDVPGEGAVEQAAAEPAQQEAAPDQPAEEGTGEAAPGTGGQGGTSTGRGTSPGFAEAKLSVALQDQAAQGLVEVERRDGAVFVTVGAGGAFASGSADLTDQAREIMRQISLSALGPNATITVTGHTDNVPLSESPYVDNFGLGAARASSVVRELLNSGEVDPSQVTAVSKGETSPVADNTTPEGREKNRRIEIEIDYGAP
jgi:chemotaxis protein MotB